MDKEIPPKVQSPKQKGVGLLYSIVLWVFFSFIFLIIPQNIALSSDVEVTITIPSLKEAVSLAIKNNLNIQMQEKEVGAARADIMKAQSIFYPQANFNASYTHNDKVLNQNIFTGYKNDNILGVSLAQSIYSGGLNIATLRQAQLSLRTQEETLRSKKLDVEFEAKRLYFGLLLAYETERITQNLFDQAKAHYEDVKHKNEQGTSSRFDLLQSKVQVSKIVPELVKARNAIDLTIVDLKKLLRINMKEKLTVTDRLHYSYIDINEGEFLKIAYLEQPKMNLKTLGIDINKWAIQVARSSNLPQVNVNMDYTYRSSNLGNMIDPQHRNWSSGFTVSVPIFDGFSSRAKVEAAKLRYQEAHLDKEDLIDQIAVDIKQACLDLRQAQSIIDYTKDNISEAKEALKISEVSYDNGEGTNLDILDAQVSLSQVEQNLASGIYDYLMAEAFLDKTMGKLSLEEAKNEKKV